MENPSAALSKASAIAEYDVFNCKCDQNRSSVDINNIYWRNP